MFKKLTLSVALVFVVTSLGCVCQPGGHFGIGAYNPCGPCVPSYDCSPCGMSACDPAPCDPAPCGPAPCSPCEQAYTCAPAACEPAPCGVTACDNACSYNSCDTGGCFGIVPRFGLGLGLGSPVKYGHGTVRRAPEEMYVTRGPRDYFYAPNSGQMR